MELPPLAVSMAVFKLLTDALARSSQTLVELAVPAATLLPESKKWIVVLLTTMVSVVVSGDASELDEGLAAPASRVDVVIGAGVVAAFVRANVPDDRPNLATAVPPTIRLAPVLPVTVIRLPPEMLAEPPAAVPILVTSELSVSSTEMLLPLVVVPVAVKVNVVDPTTSVSPAATAVVKDPSAVAPAAAPATAVPVTVGAT